MVLPSARNKKLRIKLIQAEESNIVTEITASVNWNENSSTSFKLLATVQRTRLNSPICESNAPAYKLFFQVSLNSLNTNALMRLLIQKINITRIAMSVRWSLTKFQSNCRPIDRKKRERKNILKGIRVRSTHFIESVWDMKTPANMAPIAADRWSRLVIQANPKHKRQPGYYTQQNQSYHVQRRWNNNTQSSKEWKDYAGVVDEYCWRWRTWCDPERDK